jgi:predicted RNA-binding protein YlxR (DUF448 family)
MTAQTARERQEALRARRAMLGMAEARGIYLHPDDHARLKRYAKRLQARHLRRLGQASEPSEG